MREYLSDRLALMSTVYLIALHPGALLAVPLAHSVGWRPAPAGWAVIAALSAALWIGTDRTREHRPHPHHVNRLEAEAQPVGVLPKHAWRSPTVWNLTVLFGMASLNVFVSELFPAWCSGWPVGLTTR
ncbi:hypothetical protein GCM10010390_79080 [Streptomyces mordarskii]|uniref:Uncharacterized protein n=2 Tax=Streptomyces TaxID=1883 RepID=A0ABP3PJM1_9ACTN